MLGGSSMLLIYTLGLMTGDHLVLLALALWLLPDWFGKWKALRGEA
jgi:hypothetical protein